MSNEPTKRKNVIQDVVDNDLCMGCGTCVASCDSSKNQPVLDYHEKHELFTPASYETPSESDLPLICPGAGVDMKALSLQKHGKLPENELLGVVENVRVCYATNEKTREKAASGGVVPALLKHLFDSNAIDCAYCLVPGKGPYSAAGKILRGADELDSIHGSVYHPFDFGKELHQLIHKESGRFAIVGLPCQIAGLEMLKQKYPEIAQRHVLSVGLFCGGVNRFGGIRYYLDGHGVKLDEVKGISYRHGPWPGKTRVALKGGKVKLLPRIAGNTRWKIMRYLAGFQGYWMLPRCRMCPDQISDFADIAVGDPHVPKYRGRSSSGFSLVVTRTKAGETAIKEMTKSNLLHGESVEHAMITRTQGYTLDNRRHQRAYGKIARFLRIPAPEHKLYTNLKRKSSFRHYKWAFMDLLKIKIRRVKAIRPLYPLLQAFEYLFISFYPSLFYRRLKNVLFNRGQPGESDPQKESPLPSQE